VALARLPVRQPIRPGARRVADRSHTVRNKAASWERRVCTGHSQLIRRNWRNFVCAVKNFREHLVSGVQRHQLLNGAGDYSIDEFGFVPTFKIERHATTVVDGACIGLPVCDRYYQRGKQREHKQFPDADWLCRTHNRPCMFTYDLVSCKGPLAIVMAGDLTKEQVKHLRLAHTSIKTCDLTR